MALPSISRQSRLPLFASIILARDERNLYDGTIADGCVLWFRHFYRNPDPLCDKRGAISEVELIDDRHGEFRWKFASDSGLRIDAPGGRYCASDMEIDEREGKCNLLSWDWFSCRYVPQLASRILDFLRDTPHFLIAAGCCIPAQRRRSAAVKIQRSQRQLPPRT